MYARLPNLAVLVILSACATPPQAQPWFNARAFAGMVSAPAQGEPAALDIVLDGVDGRELRISDCKQVERLPRARVVDAQQGLVDVLRINCEAYRQFLAGRPALHSSWPADFDAAFVARLPAALLPEGQDGGASGTLGDSPLVLAIEAAGGGRMAIRTAASDVVLTLLARTDVDGDGHEDILLSVGWRVRGAFGRGVALLRLTHTGPDDAIEVVERFLP